MATPTPEAKQRGAVGDDPSRLVAFTVPEFVDGVNERTHRARDGDGPRRTIQMGS